MGSASRPAKQACDWHHGGRDTGDMGLGSSPPQVDEGAVRGRLTLGGRQPDPLGVQGVLDTL